MKVMIAVDDSIHSRKYVEELTKRSWPDSTNFKLVTVIEPIHLSDSEQHKILICDLDEKRKKAAQKLLKELKKTLDTIPGSNVHFEIRDGYADQEIIDVAVEWEPDRLMIGAYGKSSDLKRLGSTARSVVSNSPCTVEVVRNRELIEV